MVDYKYKDLFWKPHVDNQLKIVAEDNSVTLTNSDIHWEQFELSESLCSESELVFGCCEASSIKFKISNVFTPLKDKWLTVTETLEGNTDVPFQYGRYKVFSDVPTSDRRYRNVTAYDSMYDIINADVSAWYNSVLPNKDSKMQMKQFRESFVRYFGLTEVVPTGGLVNDNMTVERTIDPDQISGKDVITAICEINGCFGHIGRDGKFHYIYLEQNIQGIYPADFLFPDHVPEEWDYLPQAETGHLYPQDPKGTVLGCGIYKKIDYQDYVVRQINKLQIRKEENDIGVIYGSGDNCYIIEDNFLVYGKGSQELSTIAENIYNKITAIVYRPINCDAVGNPCLEVGDPVIFTTEFKIIESYIFNRTLRGIQAPTDNYTSFGNERRSEKVNGIQKSIVQLKGKSNVLERNIEETKSELRDTEENLRSTITQTATEIRAEVAEADNNLSSRITQNANNITAEVNRATETEGTLSAKIQVNAEGISQRVVKGNVSSEISQEAGKVSIKSNRLEVESKQFKIDGDGNAEFGGKLKAASGDFSGEVNATSGTFDNVTIKSSCTVAGQAVTGSIGNNVEWYGSTIGGGYIGDGINGNYVGSGISGSNVTRGTVANGRITDSLSGKTFENTGTSDYSILIGTSILGIRIRGSSLNCFGGGESTITLNSNSGGAFFAGSISSTGSKSRLANTRNYGDRLLYCYEMPSPMFGDIGEGQTDETGTCIIFLDDIFGETIDSDCQYQVFLQPYGMGSCYVDERTSSYFIVKGDIFLKFGWELKAIQKGYDTMRLEQMEDYEEENKDIAAELDNYMKELLYDVESEGVL